MKSATRPAFRIAPRASAVPFSTMGTQIFSRGSLFDDRFIDFDSEMSSCLFAAEKDLASLAEIDQRNRLAGGSGEPDRFSVLQDHRMGAAVFLSLYQDERPPFHFGPSHDSRVARPFKIDDQDRSPAFTSERYRVSPFSIRK